MSSQCLTLGSRKIDCKQTHYTTFSIKSWIPASRAGMTPCSPFLSSQCWDLVSPYDTPVAD
ncbi:MAG: hypothetical protein ACR5LA_13080 [Wolbachia sp.]